MSTVPEWFSPDSMVDLQLDVQRDRTALVIALPDVSDEDVMRFLTSLNVTQAYISDMLAAVRVEQMRREVRASPMFLPAF